MNKQIQNLKDKIWADEYWTRPNTDKLLPAQLNRFAELIVRECAELANEETSLPYDSYSKKIKKHFGVEE
jgi:hypothetical protein